MIRIKLGIYDMKMSKVRFLAAVETGKCIKLSENVYIVVEFEDDKYILKDVIDIYGVSCYPMFSNYEFKIIQL